MENQRIRLSKTLLKNALLKLLDEKPLENISVSALCQTAGINRTTFYKYYGSPAEVLTEIEQQFFADLAAFMKDMSMDDHRPLTVAAEYVDRHRDTIRVLVNSVPDQIFSAQLFGIPEIRAALDLHIDERYSETAAKYMRLFLFQGGYAIIRQWLNSPTPEPASEIADLICLMGEKLK